MPTGHNPDTQMMDQFDKLRKQLAESLRVKSIIMTVGLPASGKTTWAKHYVASSLTAVRVNKDDIRSMLHSGIYSEEREKVVLEVRDSIIKTALQAGCDVIVDDTNFNPKHKRQIEQIAFDHGVKLEIKDFTDVPLEVCVERNAARENPVPEEAIQRMYDTYLKDKNGAKQ